jgi:predicted SAM-dependent methyltransferase
MKSHSATFKWGAMFVLVAAQVQAATYKIDSSPLTNKSPVNQVPGLHVGSMLAFKANCINVDISGIEDGHGVSSKPGSLVVLKVDDSPTAIAESPILPEDPRELYFLQHDGTKPFPFTSKRFEWIIAEHFIEHITFQEAVEFLKESRRMLALGGTLRLSTPDLAIYAAAFFDPAQRFYKEHYEVMTSGPGMEANKQFFSSRRADMFNQIFYGYGHKHIYDELELRAAAELAGFTKENGCEVRVASFREGMNMQLAQLDDAIHKDESIYLEL